MPEALLYLAAAAAGYFLGAIPFAYISGKLIAGVDPRDVGSRNMGTANVYLNVSKAAGYITGPGDIGKGVVAALVGELIAGCIGTEIAGHVGAGLAGLGAIMGHSFPVWLRFRGGKGGGAGFGALVWLFPLELGVGILGFLVVYTVLRLSLRLPRRVLGPIGTLLAMAIAVYLAFDLGKPPARIVMGACVLGLVLVRYLGSFLMKRRRAQRAAGELPGTPKYRE